MTGTHSKRPKDPNSCFKLNHYRRARVTSVSAPRIFGSAPAAPPMTIFFRCSAFDHIV